MDGWKVEYMCKIWHFQKWTFVPDNFNGHDEIAKSRVDVEARRHFCVNWTSCWRHIFPSDALIPNEKFSCLITNIIIGSFGWRKLQRRLTSLKKSFRGSGWKLLTKGLIADLWSFKCLLWQFSPDISNTGLLSYHGWPPYQVYIGLQNLEKPF